MRTLSSPSADTSFSSVSTWLKCATCRERKAQNQVSVELGSLNGWITKSVVKVKNGLTTIVMTNDDYVWTAAVSRYTYDVRNLSRP